ncbi:IS21 family transposase [Accumulibacter sp.]|uniref:Mu transposase domain-containing protein n=1 Tax=Accumulibacter sp. TaxID=2053492 RepID=UPI00338E978F
MTLAGKTLTAQCASLILAYSRCLFLQYYPRFTRFEAKQFLLEAVCFLAGCCPTCVIDNTSVIVVDGAGDDAVFAPEMVAFARTLGFAFRAHPVNQPDRKGRVERPFAWVEGHFLAGRTFADFADLNQQARAWCEKVANAKPKRVLGMAPSAAYAMERSCLQPLPAVLPPVYQVAERVVDLYGFVSIETNRYSVPERWVGKTLTVYLYASELRICAREQLVAIHPRLIGVRDAKQKLPGHHPTPQRRDRTPPPEATLLQGHHPVLDAYVAALVKQAHGRGVRPLRRLLGFRRSYPESPFLAAVAQALKFGLFDLGRLEAMILQQVAGDFFHLDCGDDDA